MKDYEQIISTLLAKIAELEEVVKQQAARIADVLSPVKKMYHKTGQFICYGPG